METSNYLSPGTEWVGPYENQERELIEFLCRPDRPNDPYEALLRETFALYTVIARRLSRQLYEEEIFVTGGVYDMQSKKYEIPKSLTAHLRLLRELRAQHRFLNEYIKKPMTVDEPGEVGKPETQPHKSTPNGSASHAPTVPEKKPKPGQPAKNPPSNVIPAKAGTLHSKGLTHDRDRADKSEPKVPQSHKPTPPMPTEYPAVEELSTHTEYAACARSTPPDAEAPPQSVVPPPGDPKSPPPFDSTTNKSKLDFW